MTSTFKKPPLSSGGFRVCGKTSFSGIFAILLSGR
jgi:hypothetical protein